MKDQFKNYPKCSGTNHMKEFIESMERLENHKDLLEKRVEFTTSLPKIDARGAIVGVKKK
jgi:hypothetical protein